MHDRKRPVIKRIRTLHRWISLCFTAIAAALIVDAIVNEAPSGPLSIAALIALVLLLFTGGWVAVHHYTRESRSRRRRTVRAGAPQVAVGPD